MNNLIEKMAGAFHNTTGIEREELQGVATVGYYKALESYLPEKGSLNTWAISRMRQHLMSFCYKERRGSEVPETELTEKECEPDPSLRILFLNQLKSMTKEAQEVCQMIFTSPGEYLELAPTFRRGRIAKQLKEKGWSRSKAWETIREIKQVLFEEG